MTKVYNLALMSAISAAMAQPPNHCLLVSAADAADLIVDGLAVQNANIREGKGAKQLYGTRLTDDGVAYIANIANVGENQGNATVSETQTETATEKVKKPSKPRDIPVIEMLPVEALPTRVRANNRQPLYPFAELAIGGSFAVKKTEARPDPVRSLQTTISAANKRHAPKSFFITPLADGARIWRGEDVAPKVAATPAETPAA